MNTIALVKTTSNQDNKEEVVDMRVMNRDWEGPEEEVTVVFKIITKLKDQLAEISKELITTSLNTLEIRTLKEERDMMAAIVKEEITILLATKTVLWEEIEAEFVAHVVFLVPEVIQNIN